MDWLDDLLALEKVACDPRAHEVTRRPDVDSVEEHVRVSLGVDRALTAGVLSGRQWLVTVTWAHGGGRFPARQQHS